jgi:hypothetical protein
MRYNTGSILPDFTIELRLGAFAMTSRERWTVYPLLFLSLGMSLRGRMAADAHETLPSLKVHELTIVNHDGKPVAKFGTTKDHNGLLEFYTTDGKPALLQGVDKNGSGTFAVFLQLGNQRLFVPFNPIIRQPPKPEVQAPEETQQNKEPESDEPAKPDAEPS